MKWVQLACACIIGLAIALLAHIVFHLDIVATAIIAGVVCFAAIWIAEIVDVRTRRRAVSREPSDSTTN